MTTLRSFRKHKVNGNFSLNQYWIFFRFYFDKLKRDHPNWTNNQKTIIIGLLWRKKKTNDRKNIIKTGNKIEKIIQRKTKKITGKQKFTQVKIKQGLKKWQINKMWKQLPLQARINWQAKADFKKNDHRNQTQITVRMHSLLSSSNMTFLKNKISE